MARKKLGLNKHQKAAYRRGERRVRGKEIEQLLEMSRSDDPAERAVAAQYLCPCHVRRRIDAVWEALYRMMEDPDVTVRRAAWHTVEDGGSPDHPALDKILERVLRTETDTQVRRFVEMLARPRKQKEDIAIKLAAQSAFAQRGKCDFCGESDVYVKTDFEIEIPLGSEARLALICERCDTSSPW